MKNDDFNNFNENDEFSEMYRKQLAEYENMTGQKFEETNIADEYNPNVNSGNPNGSRSSTYAEQRARQAQANRNGASQPQRRPQNSGNRNSAGRSGSNNGNRPSPKRNTQQKKKTSNSNKDLQFGKQNNKSRNVKQKPVNNGNNKKMKEKKNPVKRFFKWLLIILLALLILLEVMLYRYVNMVNTVDTGKRLVTNASMYDDDIMNVLVIGSDARSPKDKGRTDSIILLSIDKNTDKITMTSFMRDMYVDIPGNNWNKINAANVYGGPELLMDTIEQNFDIRVDKYVYIDFYSFVDIVDAVGGIEMKVSDEEAKGMKDPMAEQNKIMGKKKGTDYLTKGGNLTLNGNQALAYARLRYVGNADFERTERQRKVINEIKEKAVTFNPFKLNKIANASLSHLTTNMTKSELFMLGNKLPFMLKYDTQELRIPEEGMYTYGRHNGQSTLDVDFDACQKKLKETIYE